MTTFESAPNAPHTAAERKLNPWLKLSLEMGPLALFFLANFYGDRAASLMPALGPMLRRRRSLATLDNSTDSRRIAPE